MYRIVMPQWTVNLSIPTSICAASVTSFSTQCRMTALVISTNGLWSVNLREPLSLLETHFFTSSDWPGKLPLFSTWFLHISTTATSAFVKWLKEISSSPFSQFTRRRGFLIIMERVYAGSNAEENAPGTQKNNDVYINILYV